MSASTRLTLTDVWPVMSAICCCVNGLIMCASVDVHPDRGFAQQMRDARGRIAAAAIDQPFVADRFVALDQPPEETLQLGMGIDDRVEVLGLADHHFAADDRLDAIFGEPVARQNAFAGETQSDDLPPAGRIGLELATRCPSGRT